MKKCPSCDNEIKDNLAYCPHCDANLTKDVYERSFSVGSIWGAIVIFGLICVVLFKILTSGDSLYDKGYDDGSEEVKSELLYAMSKHYKEGFDDGTKIAWYFEQGCTDKTERLAPQYPDVEKYMEGYDFC